MMRSSSCMDLACSSCAVEVLDMRDEAMHEKARMYGITRVSAVVVVDGTLAAAPDGKTVTPRHWVHPDHGLPEFGPWPARQGDL